ncbi:iron(III) transport system ATP-binding protein [Alkalispirochaeta americana]|uniref:Iron(III) transport system ATP-binding protein n=1 Tax=Alkalispirochaeta americana TaxID=159291 RepID=A0A1N6N9V6_9SPIO|nr:ABC transporter ATP-binding protein [Alkalispirochaeta americana]SIP88858.1 iron(III) transport system ATP-binding protein [Alkalispirochaeta americana]
MEQQMIDRSAAAEFAADPGDSKKPDYLVLKDIVKDFVDGSGGIVRAVNSVSLSVSKGEFVTLLGPSGCGKTTTLRMIAGFESPNGGTIQLDGKDITQVPPFQRNMPMVFQSYALFPHLTIFDNIAYGLKLRGVSREEMRHDVAVASQMVNLVGLEKRYPGELSGGQQQRVALARALVLKPDIILFDEPLSNLDAKLRIQTRTEIKRVQQLLGITALYVTHDQSEALSLSDQIVIMNKGEIVQQGPPEAIYNEPNSPFVSDFIGNANFLDGEVVDVQNDQVTLSVGPARFTLPGSRCPGDIRSGEAILLSVKPEAIRVTGSAGTGAELSGKIDVSAFVGPITEYKIIFGDGIITALQPNRPGKTHVYRSGEEVALEFEVESLRAYRA